MKDFTVELPKIPDKEYNIKDFGAQNGGTRSNTKEINAAISAANAEGGGKVVIPAGIWLRSNAALCYASPPGIPELSQIPCQKHPPSSACKTAGFAPAPPVCGNTQI